MNALNHQLMMRGTTKPAILREDRKAVAAVFQSFAALFRPVRFAAPSS
ncbi:hypothetical protein [Hymenobacter sp. UV11]|nr:hypothetical protein [Hymenobacter sp. UV11]